MSMNTDPPDTGAARLERAEMAYSELISPIAELRRLVRDELASPDGATHILGDLITAMWETHESMRAILAAAEKCEEDTGRSTGGHADAVLLARPQLESVFIALLILHDEIEFVPRYHRAGWAATLKASYLTYEMMGDTAEIADWWERQKLLFVEQGSAWGLTEDHLDTVIAEARGDELTEEQRAHRIRHLPMPGSILNESILQGSSFEPLVAPLYREWKVACDPVHLGIPILAAKTFLRGGLIDNVTGIDRAVYLTSDIHHNSIIRSAIAMLTCLSAIAIGRFGANREILDKCDESWGPLRTRVPAAMSIWREWAERALGRTRIDG
ncbi:MAG: hypothetical protein ACYTGG_13005 [Planctomycetota bacterium]